MPLLPPINSAAVQVLQQSRIAPIAVDRNAPPENNLISAANGVKTDEVAETTDYWDIGKVTPTQMKVKLFEAVGEAFGLDEDNFSSFGAYASAIQAVMEQIKQDDPMAFIIFDEIEKDLGLDELGISLEEAVQAMVEPGGTASAKLDAALKEQADEINGEMEEGEDEIIDSVRVDSNGIYSLHG
ncbi:MAG: hypothetical protein COB78_01170 [Hyphomicrobiales bacterium]|nr:MAG: hypothetical protein COB78_01170 [Hyphomicrobiales bacterium]